MKNLFLLAMLLIASVSYAQERQAGVQVIFTHSPNTGHDNGVGVKGDVALPVDRFLTVLAECGWEIQPKSYIGDGSALRARVDGRVYFLGSGGAGLAPFASVGTALSRQFTSQYQKGAIYLTVGAGVNVKQRAVVYWRHFFRETQTANRSSADEIAVEAYLPLAATSPWRIRGSIGATNVRFTQPSGPVAGRHSAWAWQMGMGVGRVF